jgi:hypothetical protein
MSIAKYLAKLAQSVTAQGVLSSTAVQGGGGGSTPTISAIGYPGNDTAVGLAGGDTITLTGTNFNTGVNVVVNGVSAPVVTRISSTQLTFTAPAQTTGSYIIYVVNTDGSTALAVPGLQYSPVPTWTTAAGSLGTVGKNTAFTTNLAVTGDAPITYSIYSGTLPSGITLNSSTGVLSGTAPNVSSDTTYNFTVRGTDAQLQDIDRAFSILIQPIVYFTAIVEYLLVAGGGGAQSGGGGSVGGGGGILTGTFAGTLAKSTEYTVTVGAGGALATTGYTSSAFGLNAIGGGGGGTGAAGSGGAFAANAPAGDSQHNKGGGGDWSSDAYANNGTGGATTGGSGGEKGGGGGGAGGAGSSTGRAAGSGGAGYYSGISGSYTYYAGGGGGAQSQSQSSGSGGAGGGGSGTYSGSGGSGQTNTGGGGGGSYTGTAGSGGSGVVFIRYPDTYPIAASTTGAPIYSVTGGYRIYKFTSSGSITF